MTWTRLVHWWHRRRLDHELDAELAYHHDALVAQYVTRGLSRDAALAHARRDLGGLGGVRETYREQRGFPRLAAGWRDLRSAARVLKRSPGFTATALLTLGLGIGANTAIFSVVHAVLLRPLPYAEPDQLVAMGTRRPEGSVGNVGYTTILDWRERTRAFADIAIVRSWFPTLRNGGEPERIPAMRVSANFFRLLGAIPALGSDFDAGADTPGGWRVLMLSDEIWRRRFNGDPDVVGRAVTMNDGVYTVRGVMPRGFEELISGRYYQRAEMWALLGYDRSEASACRTCQHLKVFGRLRTDTSLTAAAADLNAVHAELQRDFPREYGAQQLTLVPLTTEFTGRVRLVLTLLMAAVGLVLLIACANVASLLLARVGVREPDLALRAAVGAGRGQLARQLFIESILLAAAGGAIGVGLAGLLLPLLTALAPTSIPRLEHTALDLRVFVFATTASLTTTLLFGFWPAVSASRINLHRLLRADSRTTRRGTNARQLLIGADIALSLVLFVAAGLMIRTVGQLMAVHPGFEPNDVLTVQTSVVGAAYTSVEPVIATTRHVLGRLRTLPGVDEAAAASQIPFGGTGDEWGVHLDGRPAAPDDPSAERYSVTPDYFSVMRIALRRGRLFTPADTQAAEPVLIVAEHMARTLWPNQDAVGRRVRIGGNDTPWRTVVGVVADVRHQDLAAPASLQMYVPHAQFGDAFLTFVVRSQRDLGSLEKEIKQAVWAEAPGVPVHSLTPLARLVERSIAPRRFMMTLLGVFAALALLMTAVGVFGVVSSAVSERTREIGIRTALGASTSDVVRLVLRTGLAAIATGVAAGLAMSLWMTRWLQSSLYGVEPTDPATFLTVIGLIGGVVLLAEAIPIARALRLNPSVALRAE